MKALLFPKKRRQKTFILPSTAVCSFNDCHNIKHSLLNILTRGFFFLTGNSVNYVSQNKTGRVNHGLARSMTTKLQLWSVVVTTLLEIVSWTLLGSFGSVVIRIRRYRILD